MEEERRYRKLIEGSVCRILMAGTICATAFSINKKYLLTVGHIFNDYDKLSKLTAKFVNRFSCRIKLIHSIHIWQSGVDYAILEIMENTADQVVPLPISFPRRFFRKIHFIRRI